VLVRLALSRQPTEAEYDTAISTVYFLSKAPGSRVNYATTWAVDSTTNTNYADIQITSSSRWEDAIAPILLVQHLRVDSFISFNGASTDFITNVQLLEPSTFAPQFVQTPTIRSVQTGAIILEAVLETAGAVYAVAIEAGDLPPTSLQVVNGLDARNMPTASSRATTAGQVKVIWSVSDLPENVYDIYVATEDLMPKYPVRSQVVERVQNVQVEKGVYTAQAYNQVNGNVTDLVPEEELEGAVGVVMTGVLLFLLN